MKKMSASRERTAMSVKDRFSHCTPFICARAQVIGSLYPTCCRKTSMGMWAWLLLGFLAGQGGRTQDAGVIAQFGGDDAHLVGARLLDKVLAGSDADGW